MENIKRTQVRLPEKLHEWLRETAFRQHTSINKMIIKSLTEMKEKQEKTT